MNGLFLLKKFTRYKLRAGDAHSIHSPFVFELYRQVILPGSSYYAYEAVEALRAAMLLNHEVIDVTDLGTGGDKQPVRQLKISFIARQFVQPAKYGQLLFRLVNRFQPETILELGSSLGITSAYLASPNRKARLVTVEGCPNTARLAAENLARLGLSNAEVVNGEFSAVLPSVLAKLPSVGMLYVDGNHRKGATLDYFRQCLSKHSEDSVFIFDDIHWSPEMEEAWEIMRNDEHVTVSIDLFKIGILFFRKGIPKQHFVLRY